MMKRWIVSNGLICMVVILAWFGNSGAQEMIDDGSTQCFGMHCCPSGYAMRGARLDSNHFLCRPMGVSSEDCFVDVPTKREGLAAVYAGVHACPTGTYMRGLHEDRGLLTCCFDRERGYSPLINERVDPDPGHQEHGMHACPAPEGNAVMTGIDTRNNHFLCSTPQSTSPITNPVISSQNPETRRSFLPVNSNRFSMWQRETRNWLARLMNLPINYLTLPAPACQVQARDVLEGGVQRLKITYPSPVDGLPITAHMLFPPGYGSTGEICSGRQSTSAQFPAILITHGHFASKDSSQEWTSYFRGVGLFLAQNGFVVLAPDTRGFGQYLMPGISGDTSLPHVTHHNEQLLSLGGKGRLPQIYLRDNVQSLSLLLATPKVNRERVANAGLSLGGFQALWLSALDTRLNATIVGGQLLSLFCQNNPAAHHDCQAVPGLSRNIDQPWLSTLIDTEDLAALIAPRRLYPMWGMTDAIDGHNPRCKEDARNATRAVYAAARVPDQLWLPPDIPGMGHDWDLPNTLQFLTGTVTPLKISYGNESDRWSYTCNGTNGMHCCWPGQALVGLKVNVNREWYFWQQDFMCRNVTTPRNERCQVVDNGSITRSSSAIAACPPNHYLQGIGWRTFGTSEPRDFMPRQFWCCQDVSETRSQLLRREVVDSPRAQMMGYHVCESPESSVMTGFAKPPTPFANGTTNDNANNQLLCSGP